MSKNYNHYHRLVAAYPAALYDGFYQFFLHITVLKHLGDGLRLLEIK